MTTPCPPSCPTRFRHFSPSRRLWLAAAGLLYGLSLGSGVRQAWAEDPPASERLIRTLVAAAFEILRDPRYKDQPEERARRLRAAADKAFDWEAMARSSLGHHWRKLTESQRQEFVRIFKELLARQYMDDLDRFRGTESIEFGKTEIREPIHIVHTLLTTHSREQLPIDYTLSKREAGYRVEDFSVEGVSLVNHYRSSFDRFLVNQDIEALLARLRRKLGLS